MRFFNINIFVFFLLVGVSYGKSLDHDSEDRMHNYRRRDVKGREARPNAEDADFWVDSAQAVLAEKLQEKAIKVQAKNTIFFLGDGMSLATVTASRIYKGQKEGLTFGEEGSLFFESFPNIGLSKTFCSDSQVADSACSATAYLTGTKANIATIGVKPSVQLGDCASMMNVSHQVESVLAWAQAAGKSTGIVTTTRVTHASPAGTYAHIADRDWENDGAISSDGSDPNQCDDIAEQLILKNPGQNINVIFGGGRREFTPNTVRDPETSELGKRKDGKNLIETWQTMKQDERAVYAWNRAQFDAINPNDVDYALGLFNYDHLDYQLDMDDMAEEDRDPSLYELTQKAVEILSKNPNGFFLFVEGGRIDHAHHDGKAQKALAETVAFDMAIETATKMTSEEDTLILVTADHAHVMTIAGYPERGNPILNIAELSDEDDLPYTTLSYANGPGYRHPDSNGDRFNITGENFSDKNYKQIATVPLGSESHGGDDVIIFSRGPFSHLLKGVVQQSYIPHVVGYAGCYGSGLQFCTPRHSDRGL